ncbi:imidazole glycerol phosphate synthase subunit HisH [Pelagicoccus sp. NFK12]|uniref:Imidazole glycerol phosphate synthase subunit HisH n=1 Tax=Pelagicoccus enzymogenes TaxID=2773457 RepID=A0A927IJ53_9BACT|nr:imidazole glycerol phosphate synthase subunit HisH [Pelagicoccus enzymogenes]MBD5781453.1 imidazole glycerol phosphate synthase subunit HisH [Pelagicoccus enzymogenes]
MITIVNYGLGNLRAFSNVYKRLNIEHKISSDPSEIKNSSKLILPGVGAFDHAMTLLQESGLRSALDVAVLERKTPIIGICVGMQMLANGSDEGNLPGLGWIPGQVRKFDESKVPQMPHMGWNEVEAPDLPIFKEREEHSRFYFLHSYYFECETPHHAIAHATYGNRFTCAVNRDNVYGVQFHPEKSHHNGVQLLRNFAQL